MHGTFKRSLCVLIVILCLLPLLAVNADTQNENLIKNPGFEVISGDWPENWNRCCRPDDPHSAIETKVVRSGKTAVKIMAEESVLPYTFQNAAGVMPGATYEVSAWANVHLTNNGNGAFFKVECHGRGSSLRDFSSDACVSDTNGEFKKLSFTFTAPEGTTSANILCRFNGTGYVIFDDVSLCKIADPEKFRFNFGDVFHYPHEEKGTMWVNLASFYKEMPIEKEATVDFELRDGEKVLHQTSGVHFTDLKAEYTYDIRLLTEKKKAYCVHATAKWNGEEKHFSQNVYVYDRPTIIGDDGVIRIEGKIFNPIMGYHIKDFTWDKVAESGINVVQFGSGGYSEAHIKECDRVLDILDANGMKALFVLYRNMKPAAHPDNIEFSKTFVNRFKDDPRIYAWAVMDEPFSSYESPEMFKLMEDSYTLVRNIDSMHPVHLTDVNTQSPKFCDIHSIDYYSLKEDNQSVYDFITKIKEGTRGDCHVQYVGRTFTFTDSAKDIPNTKTVRGYIYRAFEAGVKGIGYFSVSDAVSKSDGSGNIALYDMEIENGFSWNEFSAFNQKEVPVLYDIYVQKKYTLLNEYEGGRAAKAPYWATWTDGKTVYMIIHNKTTSPMVISPSSASANGLLSIGECTIERIGGTAPVPTSIHNLSVNMEPFDVALYKLTPHIPLDLSKLGTKNFTDLTGYDWAAEDIRKVAALGIVNTIGENRFGPGRNITRGNFAMFLIRTLGLSAKFEENFADVDEKAYFAKEVAIGRALGILKGVEENKFSPYAEITRQDMMTICYRGLQIAGKGMNPDMSFLQRFPDEALIRDYAKEAISAMANAGIVKGNPDGNINPFGNTTRAEAAVIMCRILNAFD